MAAFLMLFILFHFAINSTVIQTSYRNYHAVKSLSHELRNKIESFTTQGLWFQRICTISRSPRGRNITRFNYAVIKISKHGIIILHVPGKEIYFDLTIHMDVQANPGPFTYPNYDCLLANSSHLPSTDGASKFHYTCEQLISLL